ncbi:cytochrome c, class I [Rhodoferax ferrireducens T118]|uniref:Cytochrome c, class I n=1 Tax=Albidiferax ferrireducens (strain ATCC BAA-621 / DSM 15236 / T118) TaxID=338969 RepID=Q21Y33_ALBFT|nr:c-type cytochrome [Rhodoferax ferrireducens]ABD69320.1 cytochrome c, class I [Rhodoferax ferrireducens T118]WPC68450.1 c-type cytochrome [Rhodoferax ferrireducens]
MNKFLSPMSVLLLACITATSSYAQEIKGDDKAGEKKIAMCVGCHGIKGYQSSFPEVYKVPMISGQGAKYIASALSAYKKGDRKHPTMRGIAAGLSDQDIADVAAYYEAQNKMPAAPTPGPAAAGSAPVAALLQKGNCVSCHGVNFSQPIDPTYPKIAGQHGDYLFVALKSYKTEGKALWGRGNPIMGGVAKQFSNAELKELANYVSSLPGVLQTLPQAKFK